MTTPASSVLVREPASRRNHPLSRALSGELVKCPFDILWIERPQEQRALVAARVEDERRFGVRDVVDCRPGDPPSS